MKSNTARAAFVTALASEFVAVERHLTNVRELSRPTGTIYRVGNFRGRVDWDVAIVEAGPHNVNAAIETERLISFFKPAVVMFVGVAGGLKDVSLGDVVAATKIYAYEAGKVEAEFKPRPEIGESSYDLVQRARAVRRENHWQTRIQVGVPGIIPTAYVEPGVAGSKVVADIGSETYKFIRHAFSDALTVEMEGHGFLRAAYMSEGVSALAIRGISDLVKEKEASDRTGSQPVAAAHAAAFAFEVLSLVEPTTDQSQLAFGSTTFFQKLEALVVRLYPLGPTDRQIWARAHGNVALLEQESTGSARWYAALRALELGGGGETISFDSLLTAMLRDYPSNANLLELNRSI
jgi:nucleoside phosphorylase